MNIILFLLLIVNCAISTLLIVSRIRLRKSTHSIQSLNNTIEFQNKELKFYKTILQTLPAGLVIYDKDAIQEYVNDAVAKLFGVSDIEAHLAKKICLYNDPVVSEKYKNALRRGEDVDAVIEYNLQKATTSSFIESHLTHTIYIDTKIRILKNENGDVEKYIFILNDVTKKRMDELQKFMKSILDMIPIPIYIKDVEDNYKYIHWNKESSNLFGDGLFKTTKSIIGEKKSSLIEKIDKHVYETERPYINEEHLVLPDGKEYDTIVHKSVIYDGQRKLILGVRWDVGFKNELHRKSKILSISLKSLKAFAWYCDIENYILRFGDELKLLGCNASEMDSIEKFAKKIHPKDQERFRSIMYSFCTQNSGEFSIEYEINLNNSGCYEWWESRGVIEVVTKGDSSYKYMYGLNINIDKHKKNELDILNSKIELDKINKQNQLVLNNSNTGLIFLNNDYFVQWENVTSFMPNHSMTKNYVKNQFCYKSVKSLDAPCEGCIVTKTYASGHLETKEITDSKIYAELTAIPIFDDNNNRIGTVLKVANITEKKKISIELEKAKNIAETSNTLLRSIIDQLPCILFIKDVEDNYKHVLVNKYFCDVVGLSEELIIGKTDYDIFPTKEEADRCRKDDITAVEKNQIYIFEENTSFNGKLTYWQTTKTTIKTTEGQKLMIAMSLDITNKILAYNELEEAKLKAEQSNKLKSAFLANMSHEIRTPLNAIVGFSELMKETNNPDEQKEYYNIISTNNELLLRLINDILDLSKIEAGMIELKPVSFNVATLFDDLASTFARRITAKRNIEFLCENPHGNRMIEFDKNRFTQVITNFMTNAIKFTDNGVIKMGYEYIDNGLKVFVSDTGIGIAKDKIDKVFERFEKLDDFAQGTGLGMAICKAIIESCNGKIGLESEQGKGSTFWAWIPIKPTTLETEYI